jgi:ketosteroid isomerase-like protein
MRRANCLIVVLSSLTFMGTLMASGALSAQETGASADALLDELVAQERAAMDRWIQLDPQGYLDLYAPGITYFDPTTDKRVEDREALQARLAPMKNAKVPFTNRRYEIIAPRVQRQGDVALLTFNLVNYGTLPDRPESVVARWNSTEVYARVGGKWRIIHSHWSFTKPPNP